jgi:site-specific recombinase XerC
MTPIRIGCRKLGANRPSFGPQSRGQHDPASTRVARLSVRYLCEHNAVTHNPVKGVERPKTQSGEGKTPALGDHQARKLLAAPLDDTIKSKRDRAILSTLLFHALRATAVTNALDHEADIAKVQEWLTMPGDVVLDIFAGSNTTGQVAEAEGRRWLAFEISKEFAAASAFRFVDRSADHDSIRRVYARILAGGPVHLPDDLRRAAAE